MSKIISYSFDYKPIFLYYFIVICLHEQRFFRNFARKPAHTDMKI